MFYHGIFTAYKPLISCFIWSVVISKIFNFNEIHGNSSCCYSLVNSSAMKTESSKLYVHSRMIIWQKEKYSLCMIRCNKILLSRRDIKCRNKERIFPFVCFVHVLCIKMLLMSFKFLQEVFGADTDSKVNSAQTARGHVRFVILTLCSKYPIPFCHNESKCTYS